MNKKVLHYCGWDMINQRPLKGDCCRIEELQNKLKEAVDMIENFTLEATFDLEDRERFLANYKENN